MSHDSAQYQLVKNFCTGEPGKFIENDPIFWTFNLERLLVDWSGHRQNGPFFMKFSKIFILNSINGPEMLYFI